METNQIYTIVNEVVEEAIGSTAFKVVDTSSLVSLGNTIINSQNNTEAFLNTLPQRIGKTIFSYRAYRNKLADMVLTDFEYGMIVQKIKVNIVEAQEDPTYNLENGKSVDPWVVNLPEANNKLFVKRTPYEYPITISRKMLKEAFLSEVSMGSFISYVFGEVRNAIELGLENLGRACLANFIAETQHEVKLLTQYNNATVSTTPLTPAQALRDSDFLRYALAQIKQKIKGVTDMSTLYNDGTTTRHTPLEDQRIKVWSEFQTMLETNVQYAAFHDEYVRLVGYQELNFFQSAQSPNSIAVKRASDQTEVSVANIVGVLYDRDALGIYKIDEDVLTTPVNAHGRYYNTFYHEEQLWINDLSENFMVFTLN